MGPSREACDRCHTMKTRCVRSSQSPICVRCTRLGFSCHYSPPGRTGRPAGRRQNKNATSRTKPSPRSSAYQNSSWCYGGAHSTTTTTTITPDTTTSSIIPLQISPALTAEDATNSQLTSNFAELNVFSSNPALNDGTSSMYFMDDLFQEVLNSNARGDTSQVSTAPPSTVSQDQLEQIFSDASSSSGNNSVASVPDTEFLLMDAQAQLLRLVRALSSCSSFPQDADDAYRITDTFIKVVDDIAVGLDASSSQSLHCGGSVSYMLLSSCYMSLIQALECLVGLLRRELGPATDGFDSPLGIQLPPPQLPIPNMATNLPYMSAGNVGLAMPRRVVAEINLHLVGQAVQHLKASISQCAARVQPGLESESWQPTVLSPICIFTSIALDELEQREQTLFSSLQIPILQ